MSRTPSQPSTSHQRRRSSQPQQHNQQISQSSHRIVDGPTSPFDVIFGVAVQLARKLLFIRPSTKAVFYLGFVTFLSIASLYVDLKENYFTQKHNIVNVYGTKLGWFWTLLSLTPFISLTSYLHHNSMALTIIHLCRLAVATFFWYACTYTFILFEQMTSKCMGAVAGHRRECFDLGGKWVPGFDISGHTFILLYSILLISEEAISFRNWPTTPKAVASKKELTKIEHDKHKEKTRTVQWLFLGLFIVHMVWDFQLIITSLYYHAISHKIIGALFAVASWFVTYRVWYPRYFPNVPIVR